MFNRQDKAGLKRLPHVAATALYAMATAGASAAIVPADTEVARPYQGSQGQTAFGLHPDDLRIDTLGIAAAKIVVPPKAQVAGCNVVCNSGCC